MSPSLTQLPLLAIQYPGEGDPLRSKQYYFVYTHLPQPPEQHKIFQHIRPTPMANESNSFTKPDFHYFISVGSRH